MLESRQFPEYLTSIRERGFVEVPGAFASGSIDEINAAIEPGFRIPTVNGRIGYVQCENTRFLSSALSWNREIIEIFTDPAVIELAEIYSDAPVHLSNYRIYRAFSSPVARMHWHVDNKTDTYNSESEQFETQVVRKDKGLILILYLSDVKAGGLQLIEGSHTWSFADEKESWDDRERDFIDHAVTFNDRPRGTAILYDYRCIHRAEPYWKGSPRTSLFAQYSPTTMPTGEPVILNARDIPGLTDAQMRVLNFGHQPSSLNWPIGSTEELFSFREWLSVGNRLIRRNFKDAIKTQINRWKSS